MSKIDIIIFHTIILVGAIALWGYSSFELLHALGIGDEKPKDISITANILLFGSIIFSFLLSISAANLLSYILIARLLKAPRHLLEQVIKLNAENDKRENVSFVQGFYGWCLNVAYKNKT